jgi:serine/threonine protein kinase
VIDDPARWQRAKEIVGDALELQPDAREAFVGQACEGDAELLREVSALLAADSETRTTDPRESPNAGGAGRQIGPYLLQHVIGRGGVGQVWAATRVDDVRMRVAIKLLRPDREGDEDFQRRFRAEMQILALMRHPNIVTFLDAGTTREGQPYFAMEYVEGEPITHFCNQRRQAVDQRLRLFLQVCEAVEHAHRYALLHRDLKPSNILVTPEGVVKLLDFGIAKLLRPEVLGEADVFTRPHSGPLTPEYASPEQLRGAVLTTATDVYSLGVVLFEILTNRTPFSPRGIDLLQFQKLVTEHEAPSPSTSVPADQVKDFRVANVSQLRRVLAGELDSIVLTALRFEPDRRYPGVAELADDIRRHLEGRPVKAQPDSYWYRSRKFVMRHRVEATAAALVLVSLSGGLGESLRERNAARDQRDIAQARLVQVRSLAQSFEKTFQSLDHACRPGNPAGRALADAREQVTLQPESRELQENLAHAYETMADVMARNGQAQDAERMANQAVALRERIANSHPEDTSARTSLSSARARLTTIRNRSGVFGAVPGPTHAPMPAQSPDLVRGYEQLGEMLQMAGDAPAAIRAYSSAITELHAGEPKAENRGDLARLYVKLSDLYAGAGDKEKRELYRAAAERLK